MAVQLDMFSKGAVGSRPISLDREKPAMPHQTNINYTAALSEDDLVWHLSQTGLYRILRKLEPRTVATVVSPQYPLRGVILDTETTVSAPARTRSSAWRNSLSGLLPVFRIHD